ncbi:restriction endonuclease [Microcoleus vaginatus GB1-A2]|uniref:restriction endonuclease n=1 Tax=Microcoleus vaginatus TaxID=119532 RepID=UPI0016829C18|nr:restriction endonuclease [Microcoleus sp. FACHB-61]
MTRLPGSPTEKLEFLKGLNERTLPYLIGDILYFLHDHAQVRVVDGPGDGKRDIYSVLNSGEKHIAQCKYHQNYKSTVSPREAEELAIALTKFGTKKGLFATTARISPQVKREYIDNFPGLEMKFMDGIDLVDAILSSPILCAVWTDKKSILLAKNSLVLPFIIRDIESDRPVQSLIIPPQVVDDLNISFKNNHISKEIFEPYRKPKQITYSECGTSLISCYEAVIISAFTINEITDKLEVASQLIGRTINLLLNQTTVIRFGVPSLTKVIERKDDRKKDRIPLSFISPKSYVISQLGHLVSEKDWILVNTKGNEWHFPENLSMAGASWAGWYSNHFDCMLMLQVSYPISDELSYYYQIEQDLKIRSLESSLYLTGTAEICNNFLQSLEPGQKPSIKVPYGIGGKMLAWIHPKVLSGLGTIQHGDGKGEYIVDDEILTFQSTIEIVYKLADNHDMNKVSFTQARHIAAIEGHELLPEIKYRSMESADLFHYFSNLASPANLEERKATFVWMWDVASSPSDVSQILRNETISFPFEVSLFCDVKRGFSTKKTFLMTSLTFSISVDISTDEFLKKNNGLIGQGFEILRSCIQSLWKDAKCSTQYFWSAEVGFTFEEGGLRDHPFVMHFPDSKKVNL